MDFINQFEGVLKASGYEPVRALRQTSGGTWPRLRYMDEKRPSGRYQLRIEGDMAYGTFGSDKDGAGFQTWRSWEGQSLKPEQIKAKQAWYEAERKKAEKEEAKKHKRMATWLTGIYKRLPDAPEDHPYFINKSIERHHMVKYRPKTKCLVLPMLQLDGKVWSLQYITEKGDKFFAQGGKAKGGFLPLNAKGDSWDDLYLAESYSTGMSVRMATGLPVICSFNANNLVPVSKVFHKKYPKSKLVIAADNDQWKSERWPKGKKWVNTGLDRARQAAGLTGAEVRLPEFEPDMEDLRPTDWNDYACFYGLEKVKSRLLARAKVVDSASRPKGPSDGDGTLSPRPASAPPSLTDVEKKWLSLETVIRWHKGTVGFFDRDYSLHNAILFLSYHPDWAGTFVYDEFADQGVIVKPLPWDDRGNFTWREITDTDLTNLRSLLWSKHNTKINSKTEMNDALDVVCRNNVQHPVRDYFNTLIWDGEPRLDNWILDYCSPMSGHNDYLTRVAACFILAAVKRIYHPGAFHKQMLVLEGKQDIGKSTLLKTLATFNGIEYFSDRISFKSIDNPYLCSHLAGNLIIEFPELTGFNIQDRNKIKAWISQTEDEMQPKHKMRVVKFPRQFVLAGSTNDATWMNDPTGGIRFWPVHCGKIDIEGISKVVTQLWAEAVYRIKQGEQHWIDENDPIYSLMVVEQSSRYDGNIWLEPIREYTKNKKTIENVDDVLKNCLFIQCDMWTQQKKQQVSEALRELGWQNKTTWCKDEKRHIRKWIKD